MEYLTIHVHLHKSCTEIPTPKGDGIRRWGLWEEVGTPEREWSCRKTQAGD